MAIETNELIDVQTLPPFKKFIMSIGAIPTSYLESMSYAEMLAWFCNYLQNTVIPTVNNNGEAVEELQDLFVELKSYVDDYFDNLDIQTEINNKLDEMARSGELTNLIRSYIDPLIDDQNEIIQTIQDNTETAINNQNATITELSGRVNNLSTLTEGSTTGDAELIDIRTGFNGVTYSNAGTAVRTLDSYNNQLAVGLINGVLNNSESITVDKLNVDSNYTEKKYSYHQDNSASASSAYITYIHNTSATTIKLKGKILIKNDIDTFKIHTRVSGTNYFFYTLTKLKAGDVIYLDKDVTVPTSAEGTIRLLLTVQNTTTERNFDLINPEFLQDGTEETSGTYGYENASAGTCTFTNKTYKALATKEYVQNAVAGVSPFSSLNFGCAGDSITTEASGATNWPTYVNTELSFNDKHNVAVGSSTYANKIVVYDGITYTPQNYSDPDFAGYSTKSSSEIANATEAQQVANNCAKNHIEQFIAEVTAGTYPTPDIFIFAYGTNDSTSRLGSVSNAFSDTLANIDKFTMAGGMRYAIEKITTAYPNCQCFILNILQSAYEGNQSRASQLIKNDLIREMAEYFSIPVFNQYGESDITRLYEIAGSEGRYLRDGLHPNTAGKKKEAQFVVKQLKDKYTDIIS